MFLAFLKLLKVSRALKSLRTTAFLSSNSSILMRRSFNSFCGIGLMSSTTAAWTPVPEQYTLATPSRDCPPMTASNVAPCLPPAG